MKLRPLGGPLDAPDTPLSLEGEEISHMLSKTPIFFVISHTLLRKMMVNGGAGWRLRAWVSVRICHDASSRARGSGRRLPHFLVFYSTGADGSDEADEMDPPVRLLCVCVDSIRGWEARDQPHQPPSTSRVSFCASVGNIITRLTMMSRVAETLSENRSVSPHRLCAPLSLLSTRGAASP